MKITILGKDLSSHLKISYKVWFILFFFSSEAIFSQICGTQFLCIQID